METPGRKVQITEQYLSSDSWIARSSFSGPIKPLPGTKMDAGEGCGGSLSCSPEQITFRS
jgi:hypothetical protein